MNPLVIHSVNIAHYRLVALAKLADQAKPFYDWAEKHGKALTGSHHPFHHILLHCSKDDLAGIITACYHDSRDDKPFLFDGVGRVYEHSKACFYFFAWLIRDAPQQRLAPLISRMQKQEGVEKHSAQIDALTGLIFEYRGLVRNFEWPTVREIILDRLEGSRRSISGTHMESHIRTALVTAVQHFYAIHNGYGAFKKVEIVGKAVKVGRHSVDVVAVLHPKHDGGNT